MKICLIGTVASSTLNFRKKFIETLIKEGHEVYVFSTDYDIKTSSSISAIGAHPISYHLSRGGLNPLVDIKSTIQLKNKIKDIKPDIVFSYFSKPLIFGTFAAKLAGVPRIIGMLEGLGYAFTPDLPKNKQSFKKKLIKKIQIFLYKLSIPILDRIIFLNTDDPIDLLIKNKIKHKDYKILGPIGIDLEKFSPSPLPKEISFIFVARLLKEKGIEDFITAATLVKNHYPKINFIALGSTDSSNPNSLSEKEIENLRNKDIISFPGQVDNVDEWIKNSSVFILPSYYREGVPCSIQEAMACGRPVITTDNVGCKDTVIHKKNGFIVPINDPESLFKSMKYIIENPDILEKMAEESIHFANLNFNGRINSEKLKELVLNI